MPVGSSNLGKNTNPERWLQIYHWDCDEVDVDAAATDHALGAAVAVGMVRRIREVTARNAGTNTTTVTIKLAGAGAGATKLTFNVLPSTTRLWSSQDGIAFVAGVIPQVWTSDVTGGSTYVSCRGVEAPPT